MESKSLSLMLLLIALILDRVTALQHTSTLGHIGLTDASGHFPKLWMWLIHSGVCWYTVVQILGFKSHVNLHRWMRPSGWR